MNGKWTRENFEMHHAANPHIYVLFCRFAHRAAAARSNYSARGIFHRIRWHTEIEERGSRFKIDDGWSCHYARKFMKEYPEHKGFFRTRGGRYVEFEG